MTWKISFDEHALKEFQKLSKDVQLDVHNYLKNKVAILENPKMLGKPLKHHLTGLWHYRVEKYRIICFVEDDTNTIIIMRIAKRDKAYS